jgi:formylglycine-generating enzyme required for sulfatase activity
MAFPILLVLATSVGLVEFVGLVSAAPVPTHLMPTKPGEVREFEIANGVKMEFCWIPAGKATLGSPKEEKERDSYELEHEYETKGFLLGKHPVTQAEWKAVMGDNPSWFQPEGSGKDKLQKDKILDTSRFPVEEVSWDDCQEFLVLVNKRVGAAKVFGQAGKFVLPHEDEWEYACRGGKGNKQAFYFGNELNGTQANCDGNFPYGRDKKGDYKERPTEVGSYAKEHPHPWGLCDMHGNVWQWCENLCEKSKGRRALRGGAWHLDPAYCRAAYRGMPSPADRLNVYGFRVCFRLD